MAPKKVRNRNVGIRKVKAGALIAHPMNWRQHSAAQAGALKGILDEVGFVGTLLARETPQGMQLIDGHLRAETMPNDEVDVMVVDLTDDEVSLILATHDTLGTMAEADSNMLDALLAEIVISSGEVASMLSDYIDEIGHADPEPRKRGEGAVSNEDFEYPLVPVFNKKYDYVITLRQERNGMGGPGDAPQPEAGEILQEHRRRRRPRRPGHHVL